MDKFTIPNSRRATEKVKRYTIMFENIPILEFNIETDEVTVMKKRIFRLVAWQRKNIFCICFRLA